MFGDNGATTALASNDIPDESVHGVLDSEAPATPPVSVEATVSASTWQHPGTPLTSEPSHISDVTTPDGSAPVTTATASTIISPSVAGAPHDDTATAPIGAADADTPHELIEIKQQALGQLSPLLSHLDQSPEDKFRTLMMMIQASDDQKLVKTAYDAANAIEDEKVRAQALLDIVNEINYFTQQHQPG